VSKGAAENVATAVPSRGSHGSAVAAIADRGPAAAAAVECGSEAAALSEGAQLPYTASCRPDDDKSTRSQDGSATVEAAACRLDDDESTRSQDGSATVEAASCRLRSQDGSATLIVHFYIANHRGDTVLVVGESGAAESHLQYDAFGNVTAKSGSFTPSYTFSTKEHVPGANLYAYAYRVYDPHAGRWTQRDPIDYQDSVNLYQFCGNNGLNVVDAAGLGTVRIKTLASSSEIVLTDSTGQQVRDALSALPNNTVQESTITGHGHREGIVYGRGISGDGLFIAWDGTVKFSDNNASFAESVRDKLAPGALINLDGCNTAREEWQVLLDPVTRPERLHDNQGDAEFP